MEMLVQLSDEGDWIEAGEVRYYIPNDWSGEHSIVSECGWWIGKVFIVQNGIARYIEWLQAYSIKFDGESDE